jgi:hypothetical protein
VIPQFEDHLVKAEFEKCGDNDLLTLTGVASLLGLIRASALIDDVINSIPGRMMLTFPGVHQGGIYRLLDARLGWNYLAIPIPPSKMT